VLLGLQIVLRISLLLVLVLTPGCSGGLTTGDAGEGDAGSDAAAPIDAALVDDAGGGEDAGGVEDAGPEPLDAGALPEPDAGPPPAPCTTRITYGSAWIHGAGHPAQHDDAAGRVSWDGVCGRDGSNS